MTALGFTTDLHTVLGDTGFGGADAVDHVDEAPLVRWEPCAAFAGPGPDGCAACGWFADDHPSHGGDSVGAIVVALPTRPVLRRAS